MKVSKDSLPHSPSSSVLSGYIPVPTDIANRKCHSDIPMYWSYKLISFIANSHGLLAMTPPSTYLP